MPIVDQYALIVDYCYLKAKGLSVKSIILSIFKGYESNIFKESDLLAELQLLAALL